MSVKIVCLFLCPSAFIDDSNNNNSDNKELYEVDSRLAWITRLTVVVSQGSTDLCSVFRTPLAEAGHQHHEGQEALQGEDEEVHPEEEVAGKLPEDTTQCNEKWYRRDVTHWETEKKTSLKWWFVIDVTVSSSVAENGSRCPSHRQTVVYGHDGRSQRQKRLAHWRSEQHQHWTEQTEYQLLSVLEH